MNAGDRLVIQFGPHVANLRRADGLLVRRFTPRGGASIVQASVSGEGHDALVTLNYDNGHADIYRADGGLYRSL